MPRHGHGPEAPRCPNPHTIRFQGRRKSAADVDASTDVRSGDDGIGWWRERWLTPELNSLGGTYFPPDARWGGRVSGDLAITAFFSGRQVGPGSRCRANSRAFDPCPWRDTPSEARRRGGAVRSTSIKCGRFACANFCRPSELRSAARTARTGDYAPAVMARRRSCQSSACMRTTSRRISSLFGGQWPCRTSRRFLHQRRFARALET